MDEQTCRAIMQEQLDQLTNSAFAVACGWQPVMEGLVVTIDLTPRQPNRHGESYQLHVNFAEFPRRAPSYTFNGEWPNGVKHNDKPPGICTPGTREFHEVYHKNDKQHPWDHSVRTVLSTVAEIQRIMERH